MNLVDAFAVGFVALALVLGFRSGAVPQVFGLLGAFAGVVVAVEVLGLLHTSLDSISPVRRALLSLLVVFLAMAIGEAGGSTVGSLIRLRLRPGLLDALDRLGGGALGAGQALLMVWLLGGLIAASNLGSLNGAASQSVTLRTLSGFLPPPATISANLHGLLDASGVPDVFIGVEPLPQPPVATPAQERADAIARGAEDGTVQIEASACGYALAGSGFVVAPDYVVTNAHVIAGERSVSVHFGHAAFDATAVLFDPKLDIAVLFAPGLPATPLDFAAATPSRGTEAAVVGFPLGGPLQVAPAAVSGSFRAQGSDLYGSTTVTRDVIEVDAPIQRGDSGGPLVLPDGSVGGVVFAASKTVADLGYALAPSQVAAEVRPVVGSQSSVATGPCTG